MSNFSDDKNTFSYAFWFSAGIGIAVYFASLYSGTPLYISFMAAPVLAILPFVYFKFIETRREIAGKWVFVSALVFFQLTFMALLAYLDFIWFGIS